MLIFVSGSGKYWPQNPELVSSGKCPSGHSLLAIAVLYCYLRSVDNLSLSTLLLKEIPCYVKFCLLLGFYRYINQSLAQFSEELLWIFYHFCYVFPRCTLPLTKQIDDAEVIKLTMSLQRTDLPNIEKSIEDYVRHCKKRGVLIWTTHIYIPNNYAVRWLTFVFLISYHERCNLCDQYEDDDENRYQHCSNNFTWETNEV